MSAISRYLGAGAIIAASTLGATVASADNGDSGRHRDAYTVTPLVSDTAGAAVLDPVLQNAWGVSFTAAGVCRVSDGKRPRKP